MPEKTIAYHFLQANYRSGEGGEPPWTVGETRTIKGNVELCKRGYHASPTPYDALQYAPGPVFCRVEINPVESEGDKMVGRTRTLLAAVDVSRELRLFACECAERALNREREAGREPDARSWAALEVARRYASGEASGEELDAAWAAGRDAAWDARAAARDAGWAAARAAARPAAWAAAQAAAQAAARAAAWDGEIEWQRERLAEMLLPVLANVSTKGDADVQG
jgi:hypothetical protein